jgi:GPH family glycoside/pentoside/hexuronide:cation symporter
MKKTDLFKLSIGQIGNALAFMVMFLFLPNYYITNVFNTSSIPNTLAYLIITISFTAGAITYIFAGYLSDHTRTRWGKRRPFFLLAIPSGLAYLFLGLTIIPSFSVISMFIFFSIMSSIYAVLYRLEYCAYWSLYMDLTAPEERITTSIIFNLFGTVGTVAALVLTPVLAKFLSYFQITLIVGTIFIGSVLFAFFFGPRENLDKLGQVDTSISFLKTIKQTVSDRNFFYYLLASFFFVLGYSITVLILMPFLEIQDIDLLFLLPFIIPVAVAYFIIFGRLAKAWGRLKTFKFAMKIGILLIPVSIFLLAGVTLLFVQILLIIIIILFVVIAILTFEYAILMDLAPKGKEATYSGIYLFIIVIPIPISSALIGPIRDFITINFFIWNGTNFSFAIIFLITFIFLFVSYFFLRKIQAKEN